MKLYDHSLQDTVVIIAEIGVNHEGSLDKAIELLKLAAMAGAHIVKFQSYTPEKYVASNDQNRLQRVTRFSLSEKDHHSLFKISEDLGVNFMSTPLTEDWVLKLNPFCQAFKIASGDITFEPVIKKAAGTGKPLIMSVGAATISEIDRAVDWVREVVGDKLKERLALLHCIASYPAPLEEANLLSIPFLKDRYHLQVGYSNHVMGMDACITAIALGASIIEVHFTDNKEGRDFRDHALSFDANDLAQLISLAPKIKKSLGSYGKFVQPAEVPMVPQIRKGVVAAKNLTSGTILKEEDLMYARPAFEFQACDLKTLIGKKITENIETGHVIPRSSVES